MPRTIGRQAPSTVSSFIGHARVSSKTMLNVGIEIEPEDLIPLGQDNIITPEGFGFSSSVERILKNAQRQKGFYRARASESVTDVMEGITSGQLDVALVFEDDSDKLVGIFTETDYIKVSLNYFVVVSSTFMSLIPHFSFQWQERSLQTTRRSRRNISSRQ